MPDVEGRIPSPKETRSSGQGVGARLARKEDDRFMRGRGQYVADIRVNGLQDVAFVRSPLAHARIKAIHVPDRYRDVVFTSADLTGIKTDPRRFRSARLQNLRATCFGDRQGAPRRRACRHVRGADPGAGRGYRGIGDAGRRRASSHL